MTIAVAIKVNDGIVLAADSAATFNGPDGNILHVYNNANKVFSLHKGLPIGAITWGMGGIDTASTATILKDLRRRFMGLDPQHEEWKLTDESYTVQEVADRFHQFIYHDLYIPAFSEWDNKPDMGFMIASYSGGDGAAEVYQVFVRSGECAGPELLMDRDFTGAAWQGQPEAISRLLHGYSPHLGQVLREQLEVPADQVNAALDIIHQALSSSLVESAMPIQDAIDLAEFFVDLTSKYVRFRPGAPTVGGPIEIAAITKHEGFKWNRRKHYFGKDLNPGGTL